MTPGEDDDLERGGDDMRAAEYVLGVLSAQERAEAARRIESDRAFAVLVEAWEARLGSLNGGYEPVEPPTALKAAVDARLFGEPDRPARAGLLQSLAFWRGLAGAAVVAALLAYFVPPMLREPGPRLVASLVSDQSEVRYLLTYDPAAGVIGLTQIGGEARAAGTALELWTVTTEGEAPVSLGLIPPGANAQVTVAGAERDRIGSGAHFAISLEPAGGSPTGQPTGPVLAVGDLYGI
jgi:anti-sigma-K factor RskA